MKVTLSQSQIAQACIEYVKEYCVRQEPIEWDAEGTDVYFSVTFEGSEVEYEDIDVDIFMCPKDNEE